MVLINLLQEFFIAKTFSLDGHLRCLFLVFDLFIIALLRSLVIKRAWFPRTFFWGACLFKKFWKILVKIEVDTCKAKTCVFDHLKKNIIKVTGKWELLSNKIVSLSFHDLIPCQVYLPNFEIGWWLISPTALGKTHHLIYLRNIESRHKD